MDAPSLRQVFLGRGGKAAGQRACFCICSIEILRACLWCMCEDLCRLWVHDFCEVGIEFSLLRCEGVRVGSFKLGCEHAGCACVFTSSPARAGSSLPKRPGSLFFFCFTRSKESPLFSGAWCCVSCQSVLSHARRWSCMIECSAAAETSVFSFLVTVECSFDLYSSLPVCFADINSVTVVAVKLVKYPLSVVRVGAIPDGKLGSRSAACCITPMLSCQRMRTHSVVVFLTYGVMTALLGSFFVVLLVVLSARQQTALFVNAFD